MFCVITIQKWEMSGEYMYYISYIQISQENEEKNR